MPSLSESKKRTLSFGSVERAGLCVSVSDQGLMLATTDYHAGPAHFRREELQELGLVLSRREPRLQSSAAVTWRQGSSLWGPRGSMPEGLVLDGYLVARVSGGLDIFVTSYRSVPLTLGADELRGLGLRVRRTPLRSAGRANCRARRPRRRARPHVTTAGGRHLRHHQGSKKQG